MTNLQEQKNVIKENLERIISQEIRNISSCEFINIAGVARECGLTDFLFALSL